MYPFQRRPPLPSPPSLTTLATILSSLLTVTTTASPFCNGAIYGSPYMYSCLQALGQFPTASDPRYFVEMQVRSAPPTYVWSAFQDPRGIEFQNTVVQLPRMVSRGDCNIAIYSYPGTQTPTSTPLIAWPAVHEAGTSIATACLSISLGGTAVVNDVENKPALGMFVWQDGADFQWLMNHDMGYAIPPGLNPNPPADFLRELKANASTSAEGLEGVGR
ncbi:MAG: hypothetical protein LQ344_003760 [Seirophora lacunosa]|nr:MAG: hypothetical protein LQ344_003760 [Seirophora lacunosa]